MELNGEKYYYVFNLQGDVMALVDGNGAKVVSYLYDSWGGLVSTTGSLAESVGVKNPCRYRGYRYDAETGLYYLQSRYYDAAMGRFVNADGQINPDTTGANLFVYCENNPVNRYDNDGKKSYIVQQLLTTRSYEQKNTILYLSPAHAKAFAKKLKISDSIELASLILGLWSKLLSIYFFVVVKYQSSVYNKILKIANKGKRVKISISRSKYGTFYSVSQWNGSFAKYEVNNYKFKTTTIKIKLFKSF
ncbi:MAG: RHS repeat-associated core domain-containing protein [Oscillospiraceae bacterium]|jgi:RHS repeat-associated protein|nr:RHS repeat-associated core domain-containing protein [Oscillospiraceae bacterium]